MLGMRGVGQKTPCPDAVCTSRLKTSRPTTNSTLICGLRFRARFGTKIGLLVMCADKRADTVGELRTAEFCVSYMPSLKAKKLEKLTQEKAVLER
jgi:hypothetical protein